MNFTVQHPRSIPTVEPKVGCVVKMGTVYLGANSSLQSVYWSCNSTYMYLPLRVWLPSRGVPASIAWRRDGLLKTRPIYRETQQVYLAMLL